MVILGWKYHQHFCFRQQLKLKVGEYSFYRELYIQLSGHYSPDDQENYLHWAPTQQHEQGKWPSFEPVLETEMEEVFPVGYAILLPLFPLAYYPICLSSHAPSVVFGLLGSWRWRKEGSPNMSIIVYQSVCYHVTAHLNLISITVGT
jgi:hypothetical protein